MSMMHVKANAGRRDSAQHRPAGFTLIEACAIVAVLAVIVAVLVPQYRKV